MPRKKSEPTTKRLKSRDSVQRDTKEVLAELVGKLKKKLAPKKVAATSVRYNSCSRRSVGLALSPLS
jgi:hypothetical protein